MKLRFLTTVAATSWSIPAGAVIEVSTLTPDMQRWIENGTAEIVRDPDADFETPEGPGVIPRPFVACPTGVVVCLGGGPSLTQADVDYVRGKATVIAINDAYRLAPWADVLYAADAAWWRRHWKSVRSLPAAKVTIQSADMQLPPKVELASADAGAVRPEDDVVWFLENTGATGLERNPKGLRTGKNSGYQAVNYAVHLRAKRIVLLGYDMGHPPNAPSHWFGDHPDGLNSNSPYAEFIEVFKTIVKPLQKIGVEVINCSRTTALPWFPKASLESVFAQSEVAA